MMTARTLGLGPALRTACLAPRLTAPSQLVLRSIAAKRFIQTENVTQSNYVTLLNSQRVKRPSSPHFIIYQPQITWLGSLGHRVSGSAWAGMILVVGTAHAVAPGIFDSAHAIDLVGMAPEWLKYTGKAILTFPFFYHVMNGVRHLAWDAGKILSMNACHKSWFVMTGCVIAATTWAVAFN